MNLFVASHPVIALSFTVYGKPAPQGSMKAFRNKYTGRAMLTSDNKLLKPWRQEVAQTAMLFWKQSFDVATPVQVELDFYFARPKSASVKRRPGMTVKPDVDKLVRAIFDALTGIVIHDDSQIVNVTARKHYGDPERVEIQIQEAK